MKIEVGNFVINSDQFSMWITEKRVVENGKTKGEIKYDRVTGYYSSVEGLLKDFKRRRVWGSDVETIEELRTLIASIDELCQELGKAFDEAMGR